MQVLKSKKLMVFLLAFLLCLPFVACQNKPTEPPTSSTEEPTVTKQSETEKPQPSEPDISEDSPITLASYRDMVPGEKDGYYCSWALYVWEPLITQDRQGQPVPALAESWEMSEDGKTWTFHLRKGVKFHNGKEFTADDVIANMDRMKAGVKKSGFYPLDIKTHYPNLISYEKLDDHTVQYTFEKAAATQLFNMVNWGSPIYEPSCFNDEFDFKEFAIGTGPFKITDHVPDQSATLERYDEYWGEKAKAKTIIIKAIPDQDTKFSALQSGEIQGVLDLNAISPAHAKNLQSSSEFSIETAKSTMIRFLIPNGTKFPFNDVRMRQAVSLMIDRKEVVDGIHYGFGVPTSNILNYSTPFYKEFPVEHDVERAKSLAKEVLGDQKVEIEFLFNGKDAVVKSECELMQGYLQELGLTVNLQPMEYSLMKERMKEGSFDLARAQQGLSNGEARTIFYRFMSPEGDHNKNYSLNYNSEEVNTLMDQAAKTLDVQERSKIYEKIQEISTVDLPIIPIFNDQTVLAHSNRLAGYEAQLYGLELPLIHWAK